MSLSISNTAGIKQLHIGVMAPDGKYAAMKFNAANTNAPLVAVDEIPESKAPTDAEIEQQYQDESKRRRAELGRIAKEGGEISQDDYEWANGTGIYSNGETPMGDEIYGGE